MGRVVVTSDLWLVLTSQYDSSDVLSELATVLGRHRGGDWGNLDEEDWQSNDAGLVDAQRLLSSYCVLGVRVWCITEADRSVTTLLRPETY